MYIVEAAKNPIILNEDWANIICESFCILFEDDFNKYIDKYEKIIKSTEKDVKEDKPIQKEQISVFNKSINIICASIKEAQLLENMYGGKYEDPYISYAIAGIIGSIELISEEISNGKSKKSKKEWINFLNKSKIKLESKDMKVVDFINNKELVSDYYKLINTISIMIKHL